MKFTKLTTLLLFVFCAPMLLLAQTTCPSGFTKAAGFRSTNPGTSASIFPLCVKGSDGTLLWQADVKVQAEITSKSGSHLALKSSDDDKQVRINSRTFTNTSGSAIGFQVKPGAGAVSTGSVIGGEISPRYNDGFAAATIIGLHVDTFLKGTTAVTSSGDVRGIQIELVTDDAGTRTISGYVTGLRMRSAFSATAITGNFSAFRIEKPEAQTNSQTYDTVFDFTSTVPLVWNDTDSDSGDTEAGYIKVIVNGNDRFIVLYSDPPSV